MTEDGLGIAAALCARYSDAKTLPVVDVSVKKNGACFTMQVCPASDEMINNYMVRLSGTKGKELRNEKSCDYCILFSCITLVSCAGTSNYPDNTFIPAAQAV